MGMPGRSASQTDASEAVTVRPEQPPRAKLRAAVQIVRVSINRLLSRIYRLSRDIGGLDRGEARAQGRLVRDLGANLLLVDVSFAAPHLGQQG